MKKRILSLLLAFVMTLGLFPASALASENVVYFSASYDGKYIDDKNGAKMAYVPVDFDSVKEISLDEYDLGEYLYDKDGDGTHETTVLQLVIYAHENLYGGDWSDVTFTGSAGSSYFQGGIFGFDENLNYFVNGEFPLETEGWGATSDHIVLEPGDYVDIASFSSWDFYQDSNYGFHLFADENGDFTHDYTAEAGKELTVKLVRSYSGMGSGAVVYDAADHTISYGTTLYEEEGSVTTDDSGVAAITFPSAGTWHLWADGGYGLEYPESIVSAPAYAKVTVTAVEEPDPVTYTVTLPTETVGYTVKATEGSSSPVEAGNDFSFTVEITEGYETGENFKVLANDAALEAVEGVYTISNITENQTVTVEGVMEKTPDPVTYTVTLPTETTEYTVKATEGSSSPVEENGSFSFTVEITEGYETGENFKVLANDAALEAVEGVYTISNITENQTVTVEGVVEKVVTPENPDPGLDWQNILGETKAYLMAQAETKAPVVSSTGGEWLVFGLARAGVSADKDYFDKYYENVIRYLDENIDPATGRLNANKSTDNSRVILALTALGKDVTNVGGYNLLQGLTNTDYVPKQGINGPVFALIALNTHGYEIPADPDPTKQVTREWLLQAILDAQKEDGKWPIMDDMTPMALQALAPYYASNEAVKAAVDKAIAAMRTEMADTSETYAQMVVQLSALGMDAAEFILDGESISVLDKLLGYYVGSGAFAHGGTSANQMATEQAFYALVAYDRFKSKDKTLYDMTDVTITSASGEKKDVESVAMSASELSVKTGKSKDLSALISPADAADRAVTWTSSNPAVATVTSTSLISAKVSGVSAGTSTITATVGGKTATCAVTVTGDGSGSGDSGDSGGSGGSTPSVPEDKTITVKMRLIGAELASQDVDLTDTAYLPDYVTWMKTTSYTLDEGATVYDLWVMATEDAGIRSKGANNNYVETVWAPDELGGYDLSEFTNGARSGWMYTINGSHPGYGLKEQTLKNKDTVIWHYVNDYAHEVEDWFDEGKWPSLGDGTYYSLWLKAPNRVGGKGGGVALPGSGSSNSDKGDKNPSKDPKPTETPDTPVTEAPTGTVQPEATLGSSGEAKVELPTETVTQALEQLTKEETKQLEIAPVITGDATQVEVELPAEAVGKIAESGVALKVNTPVANITLPSAALSGLAGEKGSLSAGASADKEGGITVNISVGGEKVSDIPGGIVVGIPAEEVTPSSVLVIVDEDGNETIVKKSVPGDDSLTALLTGSASLKIVDNKQEFTDTKDHWGEDAIDFATSRGLFSGVGDNKFDPQGTMTRAMLVTTLFRLEDGAAKGETRFEDVPSDTWYSEAVAWAHENNIVQGVGNGFDPDGNITREQMSTVLYRYANVVGMDTGAEGDTSQFSDSGEVSSWAQDAMTWAVGVGLISGKDSNTLDPAGFATRTEVATIYQRMVALMVR